MVVDHSIYMLSSGGLCLQGHEYWCPQCNFAVAAWVKKAGLVGKYQFNWS